MKTSAARAQGRILEGIKRGFIKKPKSPSLFRKGLNSNKNKCCGFRATDYERKRRWQ